MSQYSVSRTIFRNSSLGFAAQAIIKMFSFAFSIIVVRQLGAESFGDYTAILAFTAIFSIFSDLGLSPYTVRQVARLREIPDSRDQIQHLYGNVLYLRFLLSFITIALIILFAFLTKRTPERILNIGFYSLTLIFYSAWGASDSVLAGFERLDISSIGKVINQLAFVVLGSFALVFSLGVSGLIGATLIAVGLMCAYCVIQVRRMGIKPQFSLRIHARDLILRSLPFGIIGLALGLSYKFSTVLLDLYRTNAETGFFNAAYNLILSFVLISNILNASLYPTLARQTINNPSGLPSIYQKFFRYLLIISLPIAVGGWALAKPIIELLYDVEFAASAQVFQIVIWTVPLMFLSEYLGYIILLNNREKRVAIAVTISSIFNVGMNFFMVPQYGVIAAAWIAVLTESILVIQHLITLRKLIPSIPQKLDILLAFISPTIMGGLALFLRDKYSFPFVFVICALGYILLVILTRSIKKEEILFFKQLVVSKRNSS